MGLWERFERMTPREFWRFTLTCLAVFWVCVAAAIVITVAVTP